MTKATTKKIKIECKQDRITEAEARELVANAIKSRLHKSCDVDVEGDRITIWSATGLTRVVPVDGEMAEFFANAKWATETRQRFAHRPFAFTIDIPNCGGYLA
jgi:hypothetical protein